jgi:capsular polysaccharide biosynthesis protein
MNLIDYGRIILRRGWIAILLAVVAAGAAFAFSQVVTPVYRGTQMILLVPSRSDLGLTEAALRLINARQAYLSSELRAQEIIDQLSLDYVAAYLLGKTTISPNRDSLAIQIDVDLPVPSDSPSDANQLIAPIVSAWGQALIDYQTELNQSARQEDRIRAQIQDNPRVYKLQPNERIYAAIGGIGGFFLGVVLIFVLEYLESNVIRRREDIENTLNLKVLAAVPTE